MCRSQGFPPEPRAKVGTIFHSKQRRKRRSGVDLVSTGETNASALKKIKSDSHPPSSKERSEKALSNRLTKFPENPCSLSVAMESKERVDLAAVKPINRVMQPGRRVDVVSDRQWIVNVLCPSFFFEHAENGFLISRGHTEPFDDQSFKR